MPTPTHVFVEIAARHGVDPHDMAAVETWFCEELPALPARQIEEILDELLSHDSGPPAESRHHRVMAADAPLPRLDDCPPSRVPLLASRVRDLPRLLLGRLGSFNRKKS